MRTLAIALLLASALLAANAPSARADQIVGDGPLWPNDDVSGALPLTGFSTVVASNFGSSKTSTEPLCDSTEGSTLWYTYTVAAGGQNFDARSKGLGFHTVLGLYWASGVGGALNSIACAADDTPATFSLPEGFQLYVQVGGVFNAQGVFQLDVIAQGVAPVLCFQYNPAALTNLCVSAGSTVIQVPTPVVTPGSVPVCVVGPVCVPVPFPTVGLGSTPVATPFLTGYVEATVLCGAAPGTCRVTI